MHREVEVRMVRADQIRLRTRVIGARGMVSIVSDRTTHHEEGAVEVQFFRRRPNGFEVITEWLAFEDQLAVLA